MSNDNKSNEKLVDTLHLAGDAKDILVTETGTGLHAGKAAIGEAALTAAAAVPVFWPVAAVVGLVWWFSKK